MDVNWIDILVVVAVVALVAFGALFWFGLHSTSVMIGTAVGPPTPTLSSRIEIIDKERGRFTARISMLGNALPDLTLALDGTEAVVSFEDLRREIKLTDDEDKPIRDLVENWDGFTETEKLKALDNVINAMPAIITGHPEELKQLILRRAARNGAKGADQ